MAENAAHYDDQDHDMTPVHERRGDTGETYMTDIDTSREAVERLAKGLERFVRETCGFTNEPSTEADTLRALLARAEAAEAERDEVRKSYENAYQYALRFADAFMSEHFPENAEWKPIGDLFGLLTQIDNMTTIARDLQAERDAAKAEVERLREALVWISENDKQRDYMDVWYGPFAKRARAALQENTND